MEGPISFWGYKEQESNLILPEHDDDDELYITYNITVFWLHVSTLHFGIETASFTPSFYSHFYNKFTHHLQKRSPFVLYDDDRMSSLWGRKWILIKFRQTWFWTCHSKFAFILSNFLHISLCHKVMQV